MTTRAGTILLLFIMSWAVYTSQGQGVVINEVNTTGSVFLELVVVGSSSSGCEEVNIQGFIIDDNNGDFVNCPNAPQALAGIGVSQGFIRFSSTNSFWSDIPDGTIIVIYPPGGALDVDASDGIITLPVDQSGYFEENIVSPSVSSGPDPCINRDCNLNAGNPSYDMSGFNPVTLNPFSFSGSATLTVNAARDAWQTRNPDGSYHHGIAYGTASQGSCVAPPHPGMGGGPDNILLSVGTSYAFLNTSSDDYTSVSNWSNNQTASPGQPNTCDNAEWLASLHPVLNQEFVDAGCIDYIMEPTPDTVCVSDNTMFSITDHSASSYAWSVDDNSVADFLASGDNPSAVLEGLSVGSVTVTLDITRSNSSLNIGGCAVARTATYEWTLEVLELADVTLEPILDQCGATGFYDVNVTPSSTTGGIFSIAPSGVIDPSTGIIDLSATGLGSYTVTYDAGIGNCAAQDVESFSVLSAPTATNATLDLCDNNGDGMETFDLSDADIIVTGGAPGVTVTYHATFEEADSMNIVNPLPTMYTTSASPDTVYARVDDGMGCWAVSLVVLNILSAPTMDLSLIIACPNASIFDLTTYNDSATAGATVIWYNGDPAAGGTIIPDPTNVDFPNDITSIYVITTDGVCSDTAMIPFAYMDGFLEQNVECNTNNTPLDPSDDYIQFNLTVNGVGLGPGFTIIPFSGTITPPTGTYNVQELHQLGPGSAGAGLVWITIIDDTYPQCTMNIPVFDPGICMDCYITDTVTNILCNDNGTPSDPTDDTFTFDLEIFGVNTGATWTADDPASTSGNYNVVTTFGPYPISGGNISFTVTDDASIPADSCFTVVTVVPPPTCSPLCGSTVW